MAAPAQFLEHRQFSVEDIARFFRVPPYMVGSMTKTTTWGAGIEQQGIGFVTYTLRPWIERLEESFSRWTLMDRPALKLGFNVDGLLRGDIKSRYDAYAVARQWGWMSANDVRLTEGDDIPEDVLSQLPADHPLKTAQAPAPRAIARARRNDNSSGLRGSQ